MSRPEPLLTLVQLAQRLGVCRNTAFSYVRLGMPTERVGRSHLVKESEARAWLRARYKSTAAHLPGDPEPADAPLLPPGLPFESPEPDTPIPPDASAKDLNRAKIEAQIIETRMRARLAETRLRRESEKWIRKDRAVAAVAAISRMAVNHIRYLPGQVEAGLDFLDRDTRTRVGNLLEERTREIMEDLHATACSQDYSAAWRGYARATGQAATEAAADVEDDSAEELLEDESMEVAGAIAEQDSRSMEELPEEEDPDADE